MSEEKILATIAGEALTEAEFERFLEKLPREQQAYAANPYYRTQILDQVINTRLMTKFAESEKLDETEAFHQTMKDIRGDVLAQLAIEKVVSAVSVSDEEAKEYFDHNQSRFEKDAMLSAKHILVEDEKQCSDIKAEIEAGNITFEDAASAHSTCPSSAKGGDLGPFKKGQMVPEFEQAAYAAEVNEVVGPVKTQFGYHLIKVYEKQDKQVPAFETVAEQVKAAMLGEKQNKEIQNVLAHLREIYM